MAIRSGLALKLHGNMKQTSAWGEKPTLINDGERKIVVNLKELAYVSSARNYCNLYSCDGKLMCSVRQTMEYMHSILSDDVFCRVNRSCIINVWQVDFVIGKCVYMKHGNEIVISKSCMKDFESHFRELGEICSSH